MMKNIALSRPATSAIAAFLVLSSPAAFAQETPTVSPSPPVATTPPTAPEPAPAPVTTAPQSNTTQPVIRLPVDLTPAPTVTPAEPAPKAAERQTATATPTPRAAPRQRAATPAPSATRAAPVASAPVASPAPPPALAEEAAAPLDPLMTPAEPVAEPTPLPTESAAATGDAFPWEIAGGTAALLLLGGAGFAIARRRRASREVWEFDGSADTEWVPAATSEPTGPAFAAREEAVVAAPEPAPIPEPRTTPTFAAAPGGSMGRHEAMAMAGPTPDNPFATLSKRLARARFLDRQERAEYDAALAGQQAPVRKPVSAWELSQRDIPAPVQQEVRRPEPARVRTDLKPGWLRN